MSREIWKPSVLLAPVPPTMVTSAYDGKSNVFTVAWTGVINTQPPKTYISVRPERFSYDLIKNSKEFVINLTTASMVKNADRCGTYTGRKVNKLEKYDIKTVASNLVACPTLEQSPVALECKVTDIVELGTHHMFLADIVCVTVDEKYIDADGKLRLDKANLAAYVHGDYFTLGKRIGSFGYSVRKKKKTDGKQMSADKAQPLNKPDKRKGKIKDKA